jgi:glycosyltransferase involved in cell wall biosynthesis
MKLSIVMPVYNERATIEEIVRRVLAVDLPLERELVIVDDGSTDGTREVLDRLGEQLRDGRVRIIKHDRNRGKGAAVRTAVAATTGDFVIIQDADLEYDPKDYLPMLGPLLDGRADVVYGSRFLGGPHRVLYFWHYVGNKMITFFSNAVNNINLSDMETCYKAFRGDLLRRMPLKSDRFGIEPELTAKACRRKLRIYEVPISYSGRSYEEGKKITWRDGLKAICTILRFRFVD